jgi:fatty-acid peroxygenase
MRGEAAAQLFYDGQKFERAGAAPARLKKTLLGRDGVQGLDGSAHAHRKALFMSLMGPERVRVLAELTRREWHSALERWTGRLGIILNREAEEVLCRAVCAWAGVPLSERDAEAKTRQLAHLIEGAGALGPRYWVSVVARKRAEAWLSSLVKRVRSGKTRAPAESALQQIATHRDEAGELLSPRVAAVELLNVLRPTVAVARFITFAAVALHEHPESRVFAESPEPHDVELFIQEVRRFYPFFPAAMARVRESFVWNGYRFKKGQRVLLDLYGTNHDPAIWQRPEEFLPERFRDWNGSAFNFIPQGGGDHQQGHRCAGEWITIAVMREAIEFLTRDITYDVPPQNLQISLSEMPTLPKSGFIMRNMRRKSAAAG